MGLSLTGECQDGYDRPSATSPHMATSAADDAFRIGQWLGASGRPRPPRCERSRSPRYRVGDMVIAITYREVGSPPNLAWDIERVS